MRAGARVVRVLLVEDHALVRAGLEELLRADPLLEVVGAAAEGTEALALVGSTHPDVVLMDLSLPGLDGIEVTRQVVTAHPAIRVVVLTSFSERSRVLAAIDAGAAGYLLKDLEPERLYDAVHAAARGESPLDPKAGQALLSARASRETPELTERELDVLALLAEGLANKQIAWRLGIAEKTVKAHMTRIFQRIGVSDRTEAASWAERNAVRPRAGGA